MKWIRPPVVAGRFYPQNREKLKELLAEYCAPKTTQKVFGVMVPHAGYIYSGKIAGEVYRQVEIPEVAIILCPNHTGRGPKISIWSEGEWQTPLGKVAVHEDLALRLMKAFKVKDGDMLAHFSEHAIEVQIPFLQYRNPEIKVVPIVLGNLSGEASLDLGLKLAEVLNEFGRDRVLVVASSDMSHYIPAAEAKTQDQYALDAFQKRDAVGLYNAVCDHDISMCGFIPTTVVLKAAAVLGVKEAQVVAYGHSGEVTGEDESVVAYAGGILH